MPLPESETVLGDDGALLMTVSEPACDPAATGVKLTCTVALCPGVSVAGRTGSTVVTNLDTFVLIPVMPRFVVPVFVRVTVCNPLVEPTFTFPKFKEVGDTLICVSGGVTPAPK